MSKKVAIIGGGCSGLGALWTLQSTNHEVHLFEAADRLGGHTNTVDFKHGNAVTPVDTGFIVLNSATYPNFIAFLKEVGVPTVPTQMTFGVTRDKGLFEWAGTSLSGVFAQRSNIFNPQLWRMLFDIIRFNQYALDLLIKEEDTEQALKTENEKRPRSSRPIKGQETVGEYLNREGYSDGFREDYLIPMTAAVWSTSPDKCSLQFPILTLVRFMYNHHLLNTVATRPTWLTIPGGSKRYIDAIMSKVSKERVHLSSSINRLSTTPDGRIELITQDGVPFKFDHVVMATHGDQTRGLISPTGSRREINILKAFDTSQNHAVLHSDLRLMPQNRNAWSAWNLITESPPKTPDQKTPFPPKVCLTYNMNILQHIPVSKFGHVLVTLNPVFPPDPALTQGSWPYSHPLYTADAIRSQALLPQIQNTRSISYCGAWTKYGFHEDGFSSGVKVAMDHLGATISWDFVDGTYIRGKTPTLGWRDHGARFFIFCVETIAAVVWYLLGLAHLR